MWKLKPLKDRWTPARYEARMIKRERRAAGMRVDRRGPIDIPAPSYAEPKADGLLALALGALLGGRRRRAVTV